MADKNSHTMLTEGDRYYSEGRPKGDSFTPITNEPYRTELRAMHEADLQRQTEAERVASRLLAFAPDAPEDFRAIILSYPVVAAYLLPIFEKAGGDAQG